MRRIKINSAGKFDLNIIFERESVLTSSENILDICLPSGKKNQPDLRDDILGIRVFFDEFEKYMVFAAIAVKPLYLSADPQRLRKSGVDHIFDKLV